MQVPGLPETEPASVRPSRFSHIVLQTSNFEPMANWYKNVLRAKPILEIPGMGSFLTYDDEHHRVLIIYRPGLKPQGKKTVGVVHWAYAFATLEQLVNGYERLKGDGIKPRECIHHGFTLSYYYDDPDGNDVELAVDVFESRSDLDAWLKSGKLAQSPIGCFVDPEDILGRKRRGDADKDIFKATGQGEPINPMAQMEQMN